MTPAQNPPISVDASGVAFMDPLGASLGSCQVLLDLLTDSSHLLGRALVSQHEPRSFGSSGGH